MEDFHNALKALICKKQDKFGYDSEVTPDYCVSFDAGIKSLRARLPAGIFYWGF